MTTKGDCTMPKTPAVFYHATLTKHLPDIQEQGLQPRIGRLSLMIDEPTERLMNQQSVSIYLTHWKT